MKNYEKILDVLAEKIKGQEEELNWKTYQVKTLQEKLEKAEAFIREYEEEKAREAEEREG